MPDVGLILNREVVILPRLVFFRLRFNSREERTDSIPIGRLLPVCFHGMSRNLNGY